MNNLAAVRKELGLSQEELARRVGLKSKGHLSQIERGEQTPSVRTALEIERETGGRIRAADLNGDVALVDRFRAADDTAEAA
ncbi:helix-turn-helix transcriptional regulator [Brevundimonas sp.]|uniref:helix-turn-helix transcriptional regulator n=1 Tax=Brevundimonas sp. TaxID=1871086 RepID=UPI002FC8ADBB